MDFPLLVRDPEKRVRSIVKKITHSGETDLSKEDLLELKQICKTRGEVIIEVYRSCIRYLHKDHAQVRVSTVKLIDYLFQKSHPFREKLLDDFDIFLELSLAISQKPKVKLKLPPPKTFAALLQELAAKCIHSWHAEYGVGYEKLRYVYKYLREHRLVDFSQFRVQTHEELIRRQKLAEKQEKILTRSIENRLRELQTLKPEIERLIAQIESLLDLLLPHSESFLGSEEAVSETEHETTTNQRNHGIANLSQNIEIEFDPYVEVTHNQGNKDIVQNLKELKKELVETKMAQLVGIEKTLMKRSDELRNTLKEIIDLKSKSTNLILKLSELKIVGENSDSKKKTLDNVQSSSEDDSDLEDVEPKEGLETYIPKSMRYEYGLEAVHPKECDNRNKVNLTDESFDLRLDQEASTSSSTFNMACNVKLESGKLCPRRDKIKCPFHGKIIARDHKGVPLDEADRLREEKRSNRELDVPDWQDPELLRDLKAATGVDLTMPVKNSRKKSLPSNRLANVRTCDQTAKDRLAKRIRYNRTR